MRLQKGILRRKAQHPCAGTVAVGGIFAENVWPKPKEPYNANQPQAVARHSFSPDTQVRSGSVPARRGATLDIARRGRRRNRYPHRGRLPSHRSSTELPRPADEHRTIGKTLRNRCTHRSRHCHVTLRRYPCARCRRPPHRHAAWRYCGRQRSPFAADGLLPRRCHSDRRLRRPSGWRRRVEGFPG